jgi:hypothetical protein
MLSFLLINIPGVLALAFPLRVTTLGNHFTGTEWALQLFYSGRGNSFGSDSDIFLAEDSLPGPRDNS